MMKIRGIPVIKYTICFACLFGFCGNVFAQVNIFTAETMRRMEMEPGWHNRVGLSLTYNGGNTDVLNLRTRFRSDYLVGKYHTFVLANFRQGKQDGESFTDQGMIHLRGIRSISQRVMVETFVQKQFNESILLTDRNLAGGGVRIVALNRRAQAKNDVGFNLYLGIGAMWENERINNSQEKGEIQTDLLRSTNYVTWVWRADDRLTSTATGYYQFHLKRLKDFRALLEGNIDFRLTTRLGVNISLDFRYDNEPPVGIKKHDLEVINGLSYTF